MMIKELLLYFVLYGLFNEVLSFSDYVTLNGRVNVICTTSVLMLV
jgi:hypothetical protein